MPTEPKKDGSRAGEIVSLSLLGIQREPRPDEQDSHSVVPYTQRMVHHEANGDFSSSLQRVHGVNNFDARTTVPVLTPHIV